MEMDDERHWAWDIGDLPKKKMAYIEYPVYDSVDVVRRTTTDFLSNPDIEDGVLREDVMKSKNTREHQVNTCGWASSRRSLYKPLGAPVLNMEKKPKQDWETPKIVYPVEKRDQEDRAQAVLTLEPGVPAYGAVNQFEYRYYEIYLESRMTLEVTVEAISGDPDVYVCNECARPTQTQHTWKSADAGTDMVRVSPDHPNFLIGAYYVGVYGIYDSEYEILATLKADLALKIPRHVETADNGVKELNAALQESEKRRKTCMFGGSSLPPVPLKPVRELNKLSPQMVQLINTQGLARTKRSSQEGEAEDAASTRMSIARKPTHGSAAAASRSVAMRKAMGQEEMETKLPMKTLTDPYTTQLCFGNNIAPRRRTVSPVPKGEKGLEPDRDKGMGTSEDRKKEEERKDLARRIDEAPKDVRLKYRTGEYYLMKEKLHSVLSDTLSGMQQDRDMIYQFKFKSFDLSKPQIADSQADHAIRNMRAGANKERTDFLEQVHMEARAVMDRAEKEAEQRHLSQKRAQDRFKQARKKLGVVAMWNRMGKVEQQKRRNSVAPSDQGKGSAMHHPLGGALPVVPGSHDPSAVRSFKKKPQMHSTLKVKPKTGLTGQHAPRQIIVAKGSRMHNEPVQWGHSNR